jgi:two-component sensor histidine kinase
LAIAYESVNADSCIYYYDQSIQISKNNKWHEKTGDSYINESYLYQYQFRSDTSIALIKEAFTWYEKANNQAGVLKCLLTEGTFWLNFEKVDSAIIYLEKAVDYGTEMNDSVQLQMVYNNLGLAYQYSGQLEKASQFTLLAIHEKEKYGGDNLDYAYINLGISYFQTSNYTESIKYSKLGYVESKKNGNLNGMGLALKNIGEAFAQESLYDSTFFYYKKAKQVFTEMNDSVYLSSYYASMSQAWESKGNTKQATDSLEMALIYFPSYGSTRLHIQTLTTQFGLKYSTHPNAATLVELEALALEMHQLANDAGLIKESANSSKLLFNVYSLMKKDNLAVKYGKTYININDSLFNEQQSEALAEQRIKFETEKKELEIQFLNTENELKSVELKQDEQLQDKQQLTIYFLVFSVMITLISIGVISKLYRKQKETNRELHEKNTLISVQKEEKEVLLKEIHHRVKNNLQIIWGLLDLQSHGTSDQKIKLAINDGKNRVKSMSMIHTMLYQNDDAGNISFHEYVQKLVTHIESTHTSLNEVKVQLDIPADLKFDIDTSVPLGLIITELFTNALKYGVKELAKGTVLLSISPKGDNQYEMIICDNGPGLPEGLDSNKSRSLGLKIVPALCQQINGSIEMNNNNGAEFIIQFKGKSFSVA